MITKNIKGLKKISYICLTLFSTMFPLAAQAMSSLLRGYVDKLAIGIGVGVGIPRQKEDFLDSLEKYARLVFEDDDTSEDEVQGGLQSSHTDVYQQRYWDFHNSTPGYLGEVFVESKIKIPK